MLPLVLGRYTTHGATTTRATHPRRVHCSCMCGRRKHQMTNTTELVNCTGTRSGPLDGWRNESTVQSNRNGLLFTMDGMQEVQEKRWRFVRSATMTRCGGECLSSCNVLGFRGFLSLSSPSIRPFASSFASSATRTRRPRPPPRMQYRSIFQVG